MPYTCDERDGVLWIRCEGEMSEIDLHALISEMQAMVDDRPQWPDNLLDLRGVELVGVGFGEVMSLARRREKIAPPNPIFTALVADAPIVIGYARMFQSLMHNPSITVNLFSTIEAGVEWLREQRAER